MRRARRPTAADPGFSGPLPRKDQDWYGVGGALSDAERKSAEVTEVVDYVCAPGDAPTPPQTAELSVSSSKTVDGLESGTRVTVTSRPVVRVESSVSDWTEYARPIGHGGEIRCFAEYRRDGETTTLAVVRWDASTWRVLRSSDGYPANTLIDGLPGWKHPDADQDGTLDILKRPPIMPGAFETTIRVDALSAE